MGSLLAEAATWIDSIECVCDIRDRFDMYTCMDLQLLEHRTHIEKRGLGMGERCFHWMWRLIVDEMPTYFRFLEIGVYKGQVLSLIKLLAKRTGKHADVTGVTLLSPFSGTGQFPEYADVNYGKAIADLHDRYSLFQPRLIVGNSTDPYIQRAVKSLGAFDVVYIDGCHETPSVISDLLHYPSMLKVGGLLVIDDASCDLKMPKGFFKGIESVCMAVRSVIETNPDYEHLLAVIHNRIWRKT